MATSNTYQIVVGCVSCFIVAIVILVAVVLYKRKKAYGGFYILTLPPLPDYIKKLDPHTPLTEQTNKLPYDAEWEFPRTRLKFCKYSKFPEKHKKNRTICLKSKQGSNLYFIIFNLKFKKMEIAK